MCLGQVIPHDFGFQHTSNFILDSMEKVRDKLAMVESLGDIEIATKLMGAGKTFDEHPADVHYRNLQCVACCGAVAVWRCCRTCWRVTAVAAAARCGRWTTRTRRLQ